MDMFPYPSGSGLHVGHPLGYIGTDVLGRFMRMTGRNVLHTMGFDAFGLPAEQYAVQTGTHPRVTTEANIARYRAQLASSGLATTCAARSRPPTSSSTAGPSGSSCRSSTPGTTSTSAAPADHRARGRARASGPATPAAAVASLDGPEQRPGARRPPPRLPRRGAGELVPGARHGAVQRGGHRRRPQRARQLPGLPPQPAPVDDADHRLRRPPDRRPRAASTGPSRSRRCSATGSAAARAPRSRFATHGRRPSQVFTTRPDTLFGATYMVARARAPDGRRAGARRVADPRPATSSTVAGPPARRPGRGRGGLPRAPSRALRPRAPGARDKTGVFTGACAINPSTASRCPSGSPTTSSWATAPARSWPCPAMTSATGTSPPPSGCRSAARSQPPEDFDGQAYAGAGPAINSANDRHLASTGSASTRPRRAIIDWLAARGAGEPRRAVQAARLAVQPPALLGRAVPGGLRRRRRADGGPRSRARCPSATLPVAAARPRGLRAAHLRPEDATPRPESPLARASDWVTFDARPRVRPEHGAAYRRETNTMPQWAGSCWYHLRYLDPTTTSASSTPRSSATGWAPRSPDDTGGVDLYVGGVEHAVLHLLYARFWHKVLYDLGSRVVLRAVPPAVQPGLRPGLGLHRRARRLRAGRGGRRVGRVVDRIHVER